VHLIQEVTKEFATPEKSIIWDYFGHAGTEQNGYCVPDGPFSNLKVLKEQRCLRRQWNKDETIPPYSPPEWDTAMLQMTDTWLLLNILAALNTHFKTHFAMGGYNGDMSLFSAPIE
jgi:hypothetical protein